MYSRRFWSNYGRKKVLKGKTHCRRLSSIVDAVIADVEGYENSGLLP